MGRGVAQTALLHVLRNRLLYDSRAEVHEHRCRLGVGGGASGAQRDIGGTAHHAAAAGPLEGGHGVGADIPRVVEVKDIRVLAHANVAVLELRTAVQDCDQLLSLMDAEWTPRRRAVPL